MAGGGGASGEARLRHLGRAARLYAPGNPFSRRALDSLAELGRAGGGDSLAAWQEVRSALLATRSFYTPHPELLAGPIRRIAALMAERDSPSQGSVETRRAWHAARLAEVEAPSVGWSLVALLGLGVWIGAAVLFILRAIDDEARLRRRAALTFGLGVSWAWSCSSWGWPVPDRLVLVGDDEALDVLAELSRHLDYFEVSRLDELPDRALELEDHVVLGLADEAHGRQMLDSAMRNGVPGFVALVPEGDTAGARAILVAAQALPSAWSKIAAGWRRLAPDLCCASAAPVYIPVLLS